MADDLYDQSGVINILDSDTDDTDVSSMEEEEKDQRPFNRLHKKQEKPDNDIDTEYKNVEWAPEQEQVIQAVNEGKNVFIHGGGGVGKSFLTKYLITTLRERKKRVSVCASTGIAAIPIGGVTFHALLGMGLAQEKLPILLSKLPRRSDNRYKRWVQTDVLIVDEISMVLPDFFDKASAIVKAIRGKREQPFGGIQVILVGDFFQMPPVKKQSQQLTNTDVLQRYSEPEFCFETTTWADLNLEVIELTKVFRQSDNVMIDALNSIRVGNFNNEHLELFHSRVDAHLPDDDGILPTCLYPLCKTVEEANEEYLEQLPGEAYEYNHDCSCVLDDGITWTPQVKKIFGKHRDYLEKNSPAPATVKLKVDAQVILLANKDFDNGLVNGSRGVVVGFEGEGDHAFPVVKFSNGVTQLITSHTWSIDEPNICSVMYRQLPLKLAWFITIHKSQGMSLDKVEISTRGIFEFGQAYVALSRARSLEGLSLVNFNPNCIKTHPKVIEWYESGCKPTRSATDISANVLQQSKNNRKQEKNKSIQIPKAAGAVVTSSKKETVKKKKPGKHNIDKEDADLFGDGIVSMAFKRDQRPSPPEKIYYRNQNNKAFFSTFKATNKRKFMSLDELPRKKRKFNPDTKPVPHAEVKPNTKGKEKA